MTANHSLASATAARALVRDLSKKGFSIHSRPQKNEEWVSGFTPAGKWSWLTGDQLRWNRRKALERHLGSCYHRRPIREAAAITLQAKPQASLSRRSKSLLSAPGTVSLKLRWAKHINRGKLNSKTRYSW